MDYLKRYEQKTITDWNGIFNRAMETEDFIYFANFQEFDDNGNVKMFRKEDLSCASNNYFGNQSLFEDYASGEATWVSTKLQQQFDIWELEDPEGFEQFKK